MSQESNRVRVLYSFPHKLGADRICYTAWQQVNGIAAVGVDVLVFPGALSKPVPPGVRVRPTLARGKVRIPYKILGSMRAFALHDYIVSRRIEKLVGKIDIVHTWPLGALRTLKAAAKLGIPSVLERPNAHTRFAYEVVQKECERIGVPLPPGHEHAYNEEILRIEEEEYQLADRLLCPSDFVANIFIEQGFPPEKLARHQYGFDEKIYHANGRPRDPNCGFTMLFVGGVAPRKGLHYALEAWLKSPAHREGSFLIAGEFIPGYAEKLSTMLSDPSIHVLGHRNDVADLMRKSDILILPTIEEGSALVTSEARGSGCVLLVSQAAGAICKHMENALVHRVGDVEALTQHITALYENRALLEKLRVASLSTVHEITWSAAGMKLLQVYREVIAAHSKQALPEGRQLQTPVS
ncbi:MAG: glycosyltransferase family 4 protein [Acidobacteriia bacterium]|nr:glycosyltransferase family 4 protein [Terriglobia bacterium]